MIIKKKNKPQVIQKNSWHGHSNTSKTAIVFVHGFMSNSKSCWTNKNTYWPNLLLSDTRLANEDYSIYIAEYYTEIKSGNYSITDCSKQMFTNLNSSDLIHQANVIGKDNIIFVCHSLGGIIVRHMIDFHKEYFANKKLGLLLMGSPSLGSKFADNPIAKKLRTLYSNTTADQLSLTNTFLVDLDHRFRRIINNPQNFTIVGLEALENHPMLRIKFLPEFMSIVVNPLSSNRYFEAQTIPGTNHSSLVKPDNLSHPSHIWLIQFLLKEFKRINSVSSSTTINSHPPLQKSGEITNVLFDVVNQNSIQYYLYRNIDESISKEQSNRSIWIYGLSGSGKTSSIKNHLLINGLETINLCLSHLKNKFNPEDFYNEILLTAKQVGKYEGNLPTFMPRQALIEFLMSQGLHSEVALYLDEIPFASESKEMKEFVQCISEIINTVKIRTSNSKIRIFFSSIESPEIAMQAYEKCSEQISLIEFEAWNNDDLQNLVNLIFNHLPTLMLSITEQKKLINKALGSPRVIKNFFRDKSHNDQLSFEQLLNSKNNHEYAY
ncbi:MULTISPECIES: alpha/beta hydrolase [Methylotenera]|uniref:alpha/beta hydrolase n=1 Tax=Methylotenera TaxID=359407 RepID=UPI00036FDCAC|nr:MULTISPECIES: hypothetical protein [Methylotenera]